VLTAGTTLGLYEIVAPIGAGGMGEVTRRATRGSGGSDLETQDRRHDTILESLLPFLDPEWK